MLEGFKSELEGKALNGIRNARAEQGGTQIARMVDKNHAVDRDIQSQG